LLATPASVAESITVPPTVIDEEERLVVIVTTAGELTVRGSHELVAPLLFASPEYAAFQLNDPAVSNTWAAESGTTPFVTATGLPTTVPVPEHDDPVKKLYVTVPPAWNSPVIAAESVTESPTLILLEESVVVMVGLAFETV